MVTVTPDQVRDRVNLSATDVDDPKVTDFIKDAEATIEEETGLSIDYTDCSQAEAASKVGMYGFFSTFLGTAWLLAECEGEANSPFPQPFWELLLSFAVAFIPIAIVVWDHQVATKAELETQTPGQPRT